MTTYTKGKSSWLSKNFESSEFDCKCKNYCSTTEIDPRLIFYLQQIRDHFGVPVTINSAYRCKKHNKNVGGANYSKHLYGQAADIKVSGIKPLKVAQYAESIGIKGIGQYSNFVHVDTRSNKYFWYGSEQATKKTFGKYVDETIKTESKIDVPINAEIKNDTTTPDDAIRVRINGGMVNIRKGPGKDFAITGKIARTNDEFAVVNVDGWVLIRKDNYTVWMSKRYIDAENKCTGDTVNLRCGPGTKYSIVGQAKKGEILQVIPCWDWWPVMVDNSVCWISGVYAKQK